MGALCVDCGERLRPRSGERCGACQTVWRVRDGGCLDCGAPYVDISVGDHQVTFVCATQQDAEKATRCPPLAVSAETFAERVNPELAAAGHGLAQPQAVVG